MHGIFWIVLPNKNIFDALQTTQYDAMLKYLQVSYLVYGIIILTNQNLYIIGKKQQITSLATTWEQAYEPTCTI